MYATPGKQEYIVPLGLLADNTDTGSLWDPLLNSRMYSYNLSSSLLLPSSQTPLAPTEWFYFDGRWGDKFYPISDTRQYSIGTESHYVTGPLGPRWKHLGRKGMCQMDFVQGGNGGEDTCPILTQLRRGRKKWVSAIDPLDGGVDVPWWALGGLDWYIMAWSTVEWLVNAFIMRRR